MVGFLHPINYIRAGLGQNLRHLVFWLLLMAPVAVMAAPVLRPVVMPLGDGPDRMATGAARMTDAILEFTRWPTARPVVQLCVAGVADHAGQLDSITLSNGAQIQVTRLSDPSGATRCDALYIGRMAALDNRRLLGMVRDAAVVTIAEADADCRSGAMFCLMFAPDTLNFQLNIDAVSRSTVRIDPRVLRLSKGGY